MGVAWPTRIPQPDPALGGGGGPVGDAPAQRARGGGECCLVGKMSNAHRPGGSPSPRATTQPTRGEVLERAPLQRPNGDLLLARPSIAPSILGAAHSFRFWSAVIYGSGSTRRLAFRSRSGRRQLPRGDRTAPRTQRSCDSAAGGIASRVPSLRSRAGWFRQHTVWATSPLAASSRCDPLELPGVRAQP